MFDTNSYKAKRRWIQAVSTIVIVVLPFLNVLRLDVPTLRFYFFDSVLWVDEFYLLFFVIMLLLSVIVFFSMVYGRVWCGWMCPQTTLNEIIHWFEDVIKRHLGVPRKPRPVTLKHLAAYSIVALATAVLALLVAFNLVAYFVDPYRMLARLAAWQLGPVTSGFIFGTALLIWVDLTFWREKFCTKVCPYGMMQFVFTDARSQIVRYQEERHDECIQCKACVRDCMMGIDIRTSPYQTECIHCGDCVDSCTDILAKLDKPGLITFTWGNQDSKDKWYEKIGLIDGKRRFILGVIAVFSIVLALVVDMRQPVSISASGDRSTLFRQEESGSIINDYSLRISNRSLEDRTFELQCATKSLPQDECTLHFESNPISLKSREVQTLKLSISTMGTHLHPGPNRLVLTAVDIADEDIRAQTEIVFFMPESFDLGELSGEQAAVISK